MIHQPLPVRAGWWNYLAECTCGYKAKGGTAQKAEEDLTKHIAKENSMVDTLWSDVSEFQVRASNAYPYHFLCFRSNDGSHLDSNFDANIAWARGAVHAGRLWG